MTLYRYPNDDSPMLLTDAVKEKIDEVKETSRDFYVEQDLFLCGRIEKRTAYIDNYLDPSDVFDKQLMISFKSQEYKGDMREEVDSLVQILSDISVPKKGLYANLVLKPMDFFDKKNVLKKMQGLPASNDGRVQLDPEEVLSYSARDIYAPQTICHESLLNGAVDRNLFNILNQNNVCGYFHTHPFKDEAPVDYFSNGDLNTGQRIKNSLNRKRFLIGTSNDFLGENYRIV